MSAVDLFRSGPITNPQPVKARLDYPNFGDLSGGSVLVYFGYVPETNPLSSSSYADGATNYADFTVYQSSGVNRDIQYGGTSTGSGTWFSAVLLTM